MPGATRFSERHWVWNAVQILPTSGGRSVGIISFNNAFNCIVSHSCQPVACVTIVFLLRVPSVSATPRSCVYNFVLLVVFLSAG
jgi:hypothetical protein